MHKTSTQGSIILKSLLHPPNFRKQKVCGTSLQITVRSECSLCWTSQHLLWEGYVGVKGSRKACVSSGGHCKNNGKVPEYREMFSQDQEMHWYVGEFPKQLYCLQRFKCVSCCQCQFGRWAVSVLWHTVS